MDGNRTLIRARNGAERRAGPRAVGRVVGALLLVGSALLLGGCKNNMEEENALLLQENAELRDQVDLYETTIGNLEQQKVDLENQLQGKNQELAAARSRPEPAQGGMTGFEGIRGTTVTSGRGEIVVGIAGDVLFESGSATLRRDAKSSLDRVAEVIRQSYPGRSIRVEGYTDSDPIRKSGWKSNEHLSAERALAVEQYLVSKNIDNEQIYAAAFGPAKRKSTKKDSRRVEIVILEQS